MLTVFGDHFAAGKMFGSWALYRFTMCMNSIYPFKDRRQMLSYSTCSGYYYYKLLLISIHELSSLFMDMFSSYNKLKTSDNFAEQNTFICVIVLKLQEDMSFECLTAYNKYDKDMQRYIVALIRIKISVGVVFLVYLLIRV